jgi:hypothetical protein
MKRLQGLAIPALAILLSLGPVSSARAETLEENLIRQMQDQGYGSVTVSRTLLGRIMVVAKTADVHREIVIHPVTGEILRDYVRDLRLTREAGGRGDDNRMTVATTEGRAVDLPDRPAVGVTGEVGAAGDIGTTDAVGGGGAVGE